MLSTSYVTTHTAQEQELCGRTNCANSQSPSSVTPKGKHTSSRVRDRNGLMLMFAITTTFPAGTSNVDTWVGVTSYYIHARRWVLFRNPGRSRKMQGGRTPSSLVVGFGKRAIDRPRHDDTHATTKQPRRTAVHDTNVKHRMLRWRTVTTPPLITHVPAPVPVDNTTLFVAKGDTAEWCTAHDARQVQHDTPDCGKILLPACLPACSG